MIKLVWTVILAFFLALLTGRFMVPWLRKLKYGQTIYDLGPQSHKKKQGTPTMGGLIFAPTAIAAAIIFAGKTVLSQGFLMVLICSVGFGLIGFVDDYIKVKKHRSLGLTPKQKLLPQIVLSAALSVWAFFSKALDTRLIVPFANSEWDLGFFYIPVMMFILVATVNSANLLDGLDGLCGGCSMIDFSALAVFSVFLLGGNGSLTGEFGGAAVFACAMAGALLGFLEFNSYPAKVFMGDVGSFFIGGALVGTALVTRLSLFLPIIAIAMVLSSLSDIIQTCYFKATHGKRVFKMAPLHHHFELSGMPETKIVTMYYSVTLLMCLASLIGFLK